MESSKKLNIEKMGKPVTVLKFENSNGGFHVDNKALKSLFLHEKVKNRKVVLFSLAGSFRRGKSFYLDYCLRYLYANYDSLNRDFTTDFKTTLNWMGDRDEKLCGFSWRSGTERDTTGMIFWSDVFLHTTRYNEKLAIFIVDTQGLFDNETTPMENSKIFALSTLVSSIQVINLNGVIREDELDYFQFGMEFAKLAQSDDKRWKAFQELVFLIRDWQNEENYAYGSTGGDKYLRNVLMQKNRRELYSVRQFLYNSFDSIKCHLLPHPGKNVAGKRNYNGQWSLMDEDFRDEMFHSIETLLHVENLIPKKIGGRQVNAENFYAHLETYFKFFSSDNLPKVTTMYASLIETDLNYLIGKHLNAYEDSMDKINDELKSREQIQKFYENNKDKAILGFQREQKLGGDEDIDKAKNSLGDKIEKHFQKWRLTQLNLLNERQRVRELMEKQSQLMRNLQKEHQRIEELEGELNQISKNIKGQKATNSELSSTVSALREEIKSLKTQHAQEKILQEKAHENKLADAERVAKIWKDKVDSKDDAIKALKLEVEKMSVPRTSTPVRSSYLLPVFPMSSFSESTASSLSSDLNNSFTPICRAPSVNSSSASSRSVNPWNSFQSSYSSTWNSMSASEKRSAGGNFQKAASRAYHARK